MFEFCADIPDMINGAYELLGAPFIFLSVLKLHRDKKVRGVSYVTVLFFTTWSLWSLYYYPHLGQWGSFAGGVVLGSVNIVWLFQIIYYEILERRSIIKSEDLSKEKKEEIKKLIHDAVKHNRNLMSLKDSKLFKIGDPLAVKGHLFAITNITTHKLILRMVSSKKKGR